MPLILYRCIPCHPRSIISFFVKKIGGCLTPCGYSSLRWKKGDEEDTRSRESVCEINLYSPPFLCTCEARYNKMGWEKFTTRAWCHDSCCFSGTGAMVKLMRVMIIWIVMYRVEIDLIAFLRLERDYPRYKPPNNKLFLDVNVMPWDLKALLQKSLARE